MQSLDELKSDIALIAQHQRKERPPNRTRHDVDDVFVKLRRSLDALGLPFRIGITPCSEPETATVRPGASWGVIAVTRDVPSAVTASGWPNVGWEARRDLAEPGHDPSPYWSEPAAPSATGRYQAGPVEF